MHFHRNGQKLGNDNDEEDDDLVGMTKKNMTK